MARLEAADGHEFAAYLVAPPGEPRGGVVIVQEIFGVTKHIRRVADQYAALGYLTIAPAMFDRVSRGIELEYQEIEQGRAHMQQLQWPNTLADVAAAVAAVRSAGGVAVVGFCWGGTVAHVAASELAIDAAVSYYGGAVAKLLDKKPRCPIVYHFGDQDHAIPLAGIDKIRQANPASTVHVYPGAGHGFNCDERASYSASDARLALARTAEFLREHLDRGART
jgi:carboxymethylenebutenolidase